MCADARDARLSNYRLERLLGSGGMGEVYLARDLALDRPVAIKFISPDKAADTVSHPTLTFAAQSTKIVRVEGPGGQTLCSNATEVRAVPKR